LTLDGSIDCAVIVESGCSPSNIVKAGKAFQIEVSFDIEGSIVPMMDGTFNVMVRVEAIGEGPEFTTAPVSLDLVDDKLGNSTATHRFYKASVNVNAPAPDGPGLPDGSYLVLGVIRYIDTNGNAGTMAGLSNQLIIEAAKNIS
jgi:hypothetical protein